MKRHNSNIIQTHFLVFYCFGCKDVQQEIRFQYNTSRFARVSDKRRYSRRFSKRGSTATQATVISRYASMDAELERFQLNPINKNNDRKKSTETSLWKSLLYQVESAFLIESSGLTNSVKCLWAIFDLLLCYVVELIKTIHWVWSYTQKKINSGFTVRVNYA